MSGHTPGYEVTRDGRVYSTASNWRGYGTRELAQHADSDGYPSVRLTQNGRRQRVAVHRLVAIVHLGPAPSAAHEVRHLNGDKSDNRVENLAWGTRKQNAADRARHGRTSRGEVHSAAVRRGLPEVSVALGRPLSAAHCSRIGDAMRGRPWSAARRAAHER